MYHMVTILNNVVYTCTLLRDLKCPHHKKGKKKKLKIKKEKHNAQHLISTQQMLTFTNIIIITSNINLFNKYFSNRIQ